MRLTVALLVLALAGCTATNVEPTELPSTPSPTPGATPGETEPTLSGRPTALPTVAPTPTPPQSSETGTFTDPAGDLVNEAGAPVGEPAWADVIGLEVDRRDDLVVTLQLAADVPSLSTDAVEQNFVVRIDADGDGSDDYWLDAGNRSDGEIHFALDDWVAGYTFDGNEFPGTGVVTGDGILWRVPRTAVGSPELARIRFSVWVQGVDPATFDVLANDYLPSKSGWVTIAQGG